MRAIVDMNTDTLVFTIFIIFTGAALFSTLALFTRQSLLVAYIAIGALLGPWGLKWVADSSLISQVGEVGIVFLLFLLGLHLQPQNLLQMLRKVTTVTLLSCLVLMGCIYAICTFYGFSVEESLIIGAALMFSSTIIGLKLLPTTVLHHQHTGELVIGVLLLQDLIAILVLLLINGAGAGDFSAYALAKVAVAFPALIAFAFLVDRYILIKLIARFDRIQEYIFLLAIAWCLGNAELGHYLGLSQEAGAFIAGVSIATSPIALYIAESLKPLRDFFLVLFFFSIGASFNPQYLHFILIPAILLAVLTIVLKPVLYALLLRKSGESSAVSWEVGIRLGQASEFSMLVAYLAASTTLITNVASSLIQAATLLTFIVSSYLVVLRYPTPIALSDKLRRD